MSDLVPSVEDAIQQFVDSKKEYHTKADVLRVIRDQSQLLYEQQLVLDALTQDPMKQLDDDVEDVQRIQKLLKVTSCHRVVTREGLSMIEASVQLEKDDKMTSVDHHVQLTFRYERRPMHPDDIVHESIPHEGTHIIYTIEVSKDFGERLRLLVVECWASGEAPSMLPALPIDGWEDMDDEEDQEPMDAIKEDDDDLKDVAIEGNSSDAQHLVDRFAAYMDPDAVQQFRTWSTLKMDDVPLFFLLMTFPFWEQEWDLVGFVLEGVFGDDDEDDAVDFDAEGEEVTP
ncbi:hypothetical protein MHU86_18748 [Fragilaria crotonensis]|nr:hypothetical protein MHU86_18748 [Fragilaria crotonensis]